MSDSNSAKGYWCANCHKVICEREGEVCLDCRAPEPAKDFTALETMLNEMSTQATVAALEAWEKCVKEGRVGNYPLPTEATRGFARKYFLTGYGMALVDHTMEATKRLRAAADQDQDRNLSKFKI